MKGFTIEEVIFWDVCYPREKLEALYAGRETLTARDVFDLPIPGKDKLYALLRPKVIPERELHLLACDFAERVTHLAGDPRSTEAIRVKRLWVAGEATDEELETSRKAMREAAREAEEAARESAWGASEWATCAARKSAAEAAAAWAASWGEAAPAAAAAARAVAESAWAAARAASASARAVAKAEARAAERRAQLNLVREVIERLAGE